LAIATALRPMAATLVPERREEITTEGGLVLHDADARGRIEEAVRALQDAGVRTSLFIAPDDDVIDASADLGVDAVELHTGEYAEAFRTRHHRDRGEDVRRELDRTAHAAAHARTRGLSVAASHGLTYETVAPV